jgi:hypothetical protein
MSAGQSTHEFAAQLGVSNPYASTIVNFGGPRAAGASAIGGASSYQLISSGFHAITAWSIAEVTGTATATLAFYDGAGASPGNTHYGVISLAPNESIRDAFPFALTGSSGQLWLGVGSSAGAVAGAVAYQ